MTDPTLEVAREGDATSVLCRACVVECAVVGRSTVEALVNLPCSLYRIDSTAGDEVARNGRG